MSGSYERTKKDIFKLEQGSSKNLYVAVAFGLFAILNESSKRENNQFSD